VDPVGFFDDTRAHLDFLRRNWSQLTQAVRTGKPVRSLNDGGDGGEHFPVLVRRLFPINYQASKHLVGRLPKQFRTKPLSVLDVGCGSGCWSIPFAEANAATRVTAVDFAPVLDVARHYLQACGVEEQYEFQAGDLRRVSFGRETHDVAFLGHVCHSEGEAGTKRLFQKLQKALKPGGLMLVVDMFVDEKRIGEGEGGRALVFALNMLVNTDHGGCFRISDYKAWAKAAGFRRYVGGLEALGQSPVLAFAK
jgi:2-polyprenyl-3-methyl-5-hydroxy-6-metoxy-1,4-benzoquinol methylase